jgi:Sensors of blue-light using FAD
VDPQGSCLPETLKVASRNNDVHGITAMTLFADGSVIQVLEGEDNSVHSTFTRIINNPAHTGVLVVADESIESRDLCGMSMGLLNLDSEIFLNLPSEATFFKCSVREIKSRVRPGSVQDVLVQFVELATGER